MSDPRFSWSVQNAEGERKEAEEEFVEEVGMALREMLVGEGVTQALVAKRTDKPASNIAHALSCRNNLKIKTVASIAWACHMRPVISFEPADD